MHMFRRVGHRGRAGWLLLLLVGIAAVWLLLQGNAQDDKAVYLALGDSTAKGTGYGVPQSQGYVARFHAFLTSALGTDLTLLNLAEDGATSETLISNQLHKAVQLLQAKGMKVAMVTVSVGGDDLFKLTEASECAAEESLTEEPPTAECANAIALALPGALDVFEKNFTQILAGLRAAGGAALPIMVMTYYNPLEPAECRLHGFETVGNAALEGKDALEGLVIPELQNLEEGLNDRIRSIAAAHQVAVAELVPGGTFPDRLDSTALTNDCQHPNEAGHAIIADAFKAAFPPTTMISGIH